MLFNSKYLIFWILVFYFSLTFRHPFIQIEWIDEEFLIFISLLIFFSYLISVSKSGIIKYFFKEIYNQYYYLNLLLNLNNMITMGFKNILLFLKHKVYVFYFELFFMFINFYKFINYSIKSTNIFFADQKILGYILNLSNYNYDINNNYIAGIPIIVITWGIQNVIKEKSVDLINKIIC